MKKGIIAASVLFLSVRVFAQNAVPAGPGPTPPESGQPADQGGDAVAPIARGVRAQSQSQASQSAQIAEEDEITATCPKTQGKAGCDSFYPDPAKTPGDFLATVTQATIQDTVCKDHYTQSVRDVDEEVKTQVFADYHTQPSDDPFGFEVDHFVSLELGGSNDPKNLWPQPYCQPGTGGKTCIGAREKDVVETSLAHRICKGIVTLDEARAIITSDWYAEYLRVKGLGETPEP